MLTLDTIFITLTLLIFSGILIKMKSSRVIIPLVLIYLFFILNKFSNKKNKINPRIDDKVSKKEIIQSENSFKKEGLNKNTKFLKPAHKELIVDIKEIDDQKQLNAQPSNKVKNVQKIKNIKLKKNEPKKVKKEIKKKPNFDNLITLKEIKICKNIKNRNPVGAGEVFSNSVDSLYCYTKIENRGKKMEVRHVWYYENQIMTQVRYNVKKSNVYRSWTKKTISSFHIGNWRVEVQDRNGTIIGTKRFKIKKSS